MERNPVLKITLLARDDSVYIEVEEGGRGCGKQRNTYVLLLWETLLKSRIYRYNSLKIRYIIIVY